MLQHVALLLPCFLQSYVACACMLSGCGCRAVSRLRLMSFEFFLQPMSRKCRHLFTCFPKPNTCLTAFHVFKYLTGLFNVAKLSRVGFDIN